jgi:hypothetical protein
MKTLQFIHSGSQIVEASVESVRSLSIVRRILTPMYEFSKKFLFAIF